MKRKERFGQNSKRQKHFPCPSEHDIRDIAGSKEQITTTAVTTHSLIVLPEKGNIASLRKGAT